MEGKTDLLSYRDVFDLRKGKITLYRRTNQGTEYQSDNWYAAFKIPGHRTIRKSLKTIDRTEAEKLAESQYFDLNQKSQKGLSLKSKKFSFAARAYLRDFEQNVEREKSLPLHERKYRSDRLKAKNAIIGKFLTPYFGDKMLNEITDFDIESYKHWREIYWTTGDGSQQERITYIRNGRKVTRPKRNSEKREPSFGTVNKELTVLRQVYEFARLSRWIETREMPTVKNVSKPKNYRDRKPGLLDAELIHLLGTTHRRYKAEKNPKHKRHLKLTLHYIAFMSATGLRVSEAKNLRLSDCESIRIDDADYLKIFVRAKGKSRELIGLPESSIVLEKLKILHQENAKIHGWKIKESMHLFVDQYGKHVNSLSASVDRALKEAGLLYDRHGIKRTAGAFRKYYITTALMNDVDYFKLAKQCGTSVNVIEKYYAEIESKHTPEKFIFKNALTGIYDEE
jgi:integrase